MPDAGQALRDRQAEGMRRLRERFQATIGNTLDALRLLASQLAERGDAAPVLDALRRELHRVHGTAGSYGFAEASRLAGEAEARAVSWSADPHLDADGRPAIVRRLVLALDDAFRAPVDGAAPEPQGPARTILLVDAPTELCERLDAEARPRGFTVRMLRGEDASAALIREIAPMLIAVPAESALADTSGLADIARDLVVPFVAMEGRARTQRGGDPALHAAGVLLIDVRDSFAPVLDVADRARARASDRSVTILALDDDPSMLAMVAYVLEAPGVEVHTISDAAALPDALERFLPSLLVSDINMPGATGIELTRRLRADPRYADLPIVLLSSETDVASRSEALEAGANEFVAKPIAAPELQHRVADRLDRHRLARIAAGLHPVSGLPVAAPTMRGALATFQRLLDAEAPCTVAVIRPAAGDPSGDETAGWLREMVRIAQACAARGMAGHHEGTALLLVVPGTDVAVAERLIGLAHDAAAGAPRWRAGLVARGDLQRAELPVALRCAEDAADVARTSGTEVVHRWRRDEGLIAPDVIVVEDDPALSDMLQYALRASGFTYRAFANGRVALDFLLAARTQGRRPIVLLDVDLPGLDGYSLHERLAVERAGEFSVVFVTVHGAESDQLRALKGGAVDFVLKPLNLRILMAKMSSWAAAGRYGASRT